MGETKLNSPLGKLFPTLPIPQVQIYREIFWREAGTAGLPRKNIFQERESKFWLQTGMR